ncbi:MAG: IPT/TIG domain-containing protein [Candidatus Margulisiibacteriota bacterium]
MKYSRILAVALVLLGAALSVAASAITDVTPANSVINPNNFTVAFADNANARVRFYTKNVSVGWTASTNSALPAGATCYGLALNDAADKLYVSVSGSTSEVRAYSLTSNGLPTGSPVKLTGAYWSPTSSTPAGLAVGGQNRLFVADKGVGWFRVYNTSTNAWLGNVTDQLAGKTNLFDIAVTPGTASYKIYVSRKTEAGEIYVYNYNSGTITYSKKLTGLTYPTYMKVVNGKLFVAVNGTDGADLKVYSTSDESLVGTVKSGVTGSYGWNSFFVSPDGAWLIFKKAHNSAETTNGLYKQAVAGISGTTTAALMKTTAFKSDGLVLNRNLYQIGMSDSPTGLFNGTATTDADVANDAPDVSTLTMSQYNYDSTALATGATAKTAQVRTRASIVDPEGGNVKITFRYRSAGTGATFTLGPTVEVASGAVAEAVLPTATATFENGGYEWGVSYEDLIGQGNNGDVVGYGSNGSSADFVINVQPAPTVTSLEPAVGVQGTTLTNVKVHGTNFQSGATVGFSGSGVTAGTVTFNNATQLTISSVTITAGAAVGARNVTVTNPDTKTGTLTNGFTVLQSGTAPVVTGITPSIGQRGTTVGAVITGSNFQTGAAVALTRSSSTITGTVTSVTGTQINCSFDLPPTAAVALWNVVVTNPDTQTGTLTNAFSIVDNLSAVPTVTNIYPRRGPTGTAHTIKIIGTNFASGNIAKLQSPTALTLTGLVVNSPTMITATIPSTAVVGIWHVTVTNTYGTSAPTAADTFEVMSGTEVPATPSQVVNLNATDGENTQSTVTWTNPADGDMALIELRRFTGSYPTVYSSTGTLVYSDIPAPGAALNQVNTGLVNGTTYYYVAFIKDTSGNWSAVDHVSPEVNADTGTPGVVIPDTISPDAVSNLTANPGASAGEVSLTWTAPGDDHMAGTVAGYQVRYATSNSPFANPFTNDNFATTGTTYDTAAWSGLVAGGATESRVLTGLPSSPIMPTYIWVAIKAYDEVPNVGPLGQNSTVETLVKDSLPVPTVTRIYPSRAPNTAATLIVIEGTNFVSGAVANIQTSPATALTGTSIISATKILATVPASLIAGTYHITVTTGGGTSAQTAVDTFEVMNGNEDPTTQAQVLNFNAADGESAQSTLTWTNPVDNDMATIEVRRYTGAYPLAYDPTSPAVYSEGPVEPGATRNFVDTGLIDGVTYYYVAFIKDTSNNWSIVDYTTPGVNADTALPGTAPVDPISSISITREGEAAGSGIKVTWTTDPAGLGVDIYALTCTADTGTGDYSSYFTTDAAAWTKVADNVTIGTYSIPSSVGTGTAQYYKLITHGATLVNSDLTTEVVGKFDIAVGTEPERFFVSIPLELTDYSLESALGGQVQNNDWIGKFNDSEEIVQGSMFTSGSWQDFPVVPAVPKVTNIELGHGYGYFTSTSRFMTVVGRLPEANFSMTVSGGPSANPNWIGQPYPVPVALSSAGLNSTNYSTNIAEASRVFRLKGNAEAEGGAAGLAFHKEETLWTDGSFMDASSLMLKPGKGYYLRDLVNSSTNWQMARPY